MYVSAVRVEDTCPKHFTEIHISKLEDAFSKRQKPDEIQLHVLAMECNLLYCDVKAWFKARRLKWIEDLVREDINNNNNPKNKVQHVNKKIQSKQKNAATSPVKN